MSVKKSPLGSTTGTSKHHLNKTKKYFDELEDRVYFVSYDTSDRVIITMFDDGEKYQEVAPSYPTSLLEIKALNLF